MSSCTILAADASGQLESQDEFGNSHGFASFVWDALISKYSEEYAHAIKSTSYYGDRDPVPLWKWVSEGAPRRYGSDLTPVPARLRPWELNVLHLTYDMAYIKGERDLLRFADSCEIFAEAHALPARICHLVEIAEATRRLVRSGFVYLGFYPSSNSENLWGGFSKNEEEYQLYNFEKNPDGFVWTHEPSLYKMYEPTRSRWCLQSEPEKD